MNPVVTWICIAAAMLAVELLGLGGLVFLPFAAGAAVAAGFAVADYSVAVQMVAGVITSACAFAAMYPLRRRLDARPAPPVGATRLVGAVVKCSTDVTGEGGDVVLEAEMWRATTADGSTVPAGAVARVVDVRGTRLVVTAHDQPASSTSGTQPVPADHGGSQ